MSELQQPKLTVLFIDDEPDILDYFKDCFEDEYNLLTASSGVEAISLLKQYPSPEEIAVIVCDHLMPSMTGIEFLKHDLTKSLAAKKILLSGESDKSVIIEAVNDGNLFHYIDKPIEEEHLSIQIQKAIEVWLLEHENQKLVKQLKQFNLSLETKIKEKVAEASSLLRVVCHDIVNPLSVAVSAIHILQEEIKDPNTLKFLKKVERANGIIEEILNGVRNLYSIKTGKANLKLSPCYLKESIEEIEFIFDDKIKEKSLTMATDLDENLVVMCDANMLRNNILANIISNAIKFSKPGGEIKITGRQNDETTTITVTDSGVGIPAEILENLFSQTASTSREGTEGETGTGFGMPIMKAAIEACSGTIDVTSIEAGEGATPGTTFSITLPSAKMATSA